MYPTIPTNILYISYDGMTDPLGQSQVLPYLKGLSAKGYRIHLLSFEKAENFNKNKHLIQSIVDEAGIVWHPEKYTKQPPVFSTFYDVVLLKRRAQKLHKKHNFSLVHCRSYIAAFGAVLLKRKFGVKFLFDMRGFWPDERLDGNIWKLSNPVYRIVYDYFKRKEQQFFNAADYSISLTENGKREIHSWDQLKQQPVPIKVIPCCVDVNHFTPTAKQKEQTEKLRQELTITPSDYILTYLGSIGTWYMLDEMLAFFKQLLVKKSNARFLFITGESTEMIFQKAQKKDLPKDKLIVRKASRELVPAYIGLSRASVFFIKPAYSKKASSPTKLAELMAMEIPVVVNSGYGDVAEIVHETQAGVVLDDFSDISMEKGVEQILDFEGEDTRYIRKAAEERFSLELGVQHYVEVYEELLDLKG